MLELLNKRVFERLLLIVDGYIFDSAFLKSLRENPESSLSDLLGPELSEKKRLCQSDSAEPVVLFFDDLQALESYSDVDFILNYDGSVNEGAPRRSVAISSYTTTSGETQTIPLRPRKLVLGSKYFMVNGCLQQLKDSWKKFQSTSYPSKYRNIIVATGGTDP